MLSNGLVRYSCLLRSRTATASHRAATAATRIETTTWSLVADASTASGAAARVCSEGLGPESAFLDSKLDAVDVVGVIADGSLEASRGLEVNKGTVLHRSVSYG